MVDRAGGGSREAVEAARARCRPGQDGQEKGRRSLTARDTALVAIPAELTSVASVTPYPREIRAILLEELHRRGVGVDQPIGDRQFEMYLHAVIRSPRRAVASATWRQLEGLAGVAGTLWRLRTPRWIFPPEGTPSLVSWRDDQEEVIVQLRLDDLYPAARPVVERLFAELPYQSEDADPASAVRLFEY